MRIDLYCNRYWNVPVNNNKISNLTAGHKKQSKTIRYGDYSLVIGYTKNRVAVTDDYVIGDVNPASYSGSNLSDINCEIPTTTYSSIPLTANVSTAGVYERKWSQNDDETTEMYLIPWSDSAWTDYQGHGATYYDTSTRVGNVYSTDINAYPQESTEPSPDGYMYFYVGKVLSEYKKDTLHAVTLTSTNPDRYPENSIVVEGEKKYWYVYQDIQKVVLTTYYPSVICGHMNYRQSAGNSNELALGAVGGASITLDVFKPLVEVLPYVDHEAWAYFKYENQAKYYNEGLFTIRELTENGLSKTTITMYDNVERLKKNAYPLLKLLDYPVSANALFCMVCSYCNIPYDIEVSFLNEYAQLAQMPENAEDLTCFDVMT